MIVCDPETGLNNSWWRYYDPFTGRFPQSDPAGLPGGSFSTYLYANANPISRIDPFGLSTFQLGFGGSANIGGGVGLNLSGGFGAAIDSSGNITTYAYGGGGVYGGTPGISGGVQASISNAKTVSDLSGPFDNSSFSAGVGPSLSIDGFQGNVGTANEIRGSGITLGVGIGAGGAIGETFTGLGSIGRLWPETINPNASPNASSAGCH